MRRAALDPARSGSRAAQDRALENYTRFHCGRFRVLDDFGRRQEMLGHSDRRARRTRQSSACVARNDRARPAANDTAHAEHVRIRSLATACRGSAQRQVVILAALETPRACRPNAPRATGGTRARCLTMFCPSQQIRVPARLEIRRSMTPGHDLVLIGKEQICTADIAAIAVPPCAPSACRRQQIVVIHERHELATRQCQRRVRRRDDPAIRRQRHGTHPGIRRFTESQDGQELRRRRTVIRQA